MTTDSYAGVPSSPDAVRAASASLFAASQRLEEVIAAAPPVEPWRGQLRDALEACRSAVEFHIQRLDGEGGLREDLGGEAPRLLSRLQRLDSELEHLLPELLSASQTTNRIGVTDPLVHIVEQIRHVADEEVDLIYEALTPMGSGD